MKVSKLTVQTEEDIPVIAALPYHVAFDNDELPEEMNYDAEQQLTTYFSSGGKGYSTSRDDDSVWTLIPYTTKSDTKKDD